MRFIPFTCAALMLLSTHALADDSSATLGTGGLVLQKTDKIALVSEDLYLSPKGIRISYRFRNLTNADYATTIAFPMPAFPGGGSNSTTVVPDPASDNFMKFKTVVDGQSVPSKLEQRAFLVADGQPDKEITDKLKALHISLVPTAEATEATISHLSNAQRKELVDAGIFDAGEGDYTGQPATLYPLWTLRSKYWRPQIFPKGKDMIVEQSYVPVVGSQSTLSLGSPDMDSDQLKHYRDTFCTDETFLKAARSLHKKLDDANPTVQAFEQYLSYVITSGGNWAGPIADFKLIVDKGDPKTLVSFCGDGVKKISPTQFELDIKNYAPKRDIDVLLLRTMPVQ
ncbi:DUF4424 domain-containing protein [Rhizobium sp. CNPSo 3464]|uniref:DUF4424 domain-containing protein n=1 Tax=Rhizobium sp. CNPSo 3464 TaxID=3021406 RepID=UPI00254D769C|nr:DUF4424 domain-containing protein [Rhizobium sp. CNPSo 3464]MDK4743658.1 DUF4424 domain-containing protein [Rhizobium sp. CNPSo 3464]